MGSFWISCTVGTLPVVTSLSSGKASSSATHIILHSCADGMVHVTFDVFEWRALGKLVEIEVHWWKTLLFLASCSHTYTVEQVQFLL